MGKVTNRTSTTSQGILGLSPWNDSTYTYTVGMINLGTNFISLLEIVSALNCFNLARWEYYFETPYCVQKYNPKVYFGTIHSVADRWNVDLQSGQNWGEKSGS